MRILNAVGFFVLLGLAKLACAYPVVDAVVGLPYPELVTVYPDEADPNLYYFVPTSVEFVRDEAGKPRLGVQHWGFTGPDMGGGMGAALTFSVRPAFDKQKLQAVADAVRAKNPNAKWAAVPMVCSRMEVIINSQFFPENQTITNVTLSPGSGPVTPAPAATTAVLATADKPVVTLETAATTPSLCTATYGQDSTIASRGGNADAIQAFSVGLNHIGARAFALKAASDQDVLGARYTFVFRGVGKRLHATITVNAKRVYDHFKYESSSSAWWGLVNTRFAVDWQKLTNDGSIKVDFLEGGSSDKDDYMMEVFKALVTAKIAGTGMFQPELKPGGLPGAPESSKFGWGFSGGGGWEHLEESNNFVFEIRRQALEERELSAALTFNAVCGMYPNNFSDLTTPGNTCIDPKLMANLKKKTDKCVADRRVDLKKQLDQGLITKEYWARRSETLEKEPCY